MGIYLLPNWLQVILDAFAYNHSLFFAVLYRFKSLAIKMKTYYSAEDPENLIDAAQSAILLVEQTKNDIMQATEDAI